MNIWKKCDGSSGVYRRVNEIDLVPVVADSTSTKIVLYIPDRLVNGYCRTEHGWYSCRAGAGGKVAVTCNAAPFIARANEQPLMSATTYQRKIVRSEMLGELWTAGEHASCD